MHNAIESIDKDEIKDTLKNQNSQIKGSGDQQELNGPQLVISSPAGLATTTPESTHLNSGKHTTLTSGGLFSLASAKSFLATALDRVNIFAHKLGIRIFASQGKVEIQAQSDDLDIIAEKVIRIISAQEKIILAAPKEVEIIGGGSYAKFNKDGIEMGTSGNFVVHAAKHSFVGPKSATPDDCPLPSGLINDEQFVALDGTGNPFPHMPFKIVEDGNESAVLAEGVTSIDGSAPRIYTVSEKKLKVIWDVKKYLGLEDS